MSTLRQLIEAKIKTDVPTFKEVAGASGLQQIYSNALVSPSCFVFLDSESAKPNLDTEVAQCEGVWLRYAVVVVLHNVRDARGGDASDVADELKQQVKTALNGWQPTANSDDLRWRGGAMLPFSKNGFYLFKTVYEVRVYDQPSG